MSKCNCFGWMRIFRRKDSGPDSDVVIEEIIAVSPVNQMKASSSSTNSSSRSVVRDAFDKFLSRSPGDAHTLSYERKFCLNPSGTLIVNRSSPGGASQTSVSSIPTTDTTSQRQTSESRRPSPNDNRSLSSSNCATPGTFSVDSFPTVSDASMRATSCDSLTDTVHDSLFTPYSDILQTPGGAILTTLSSTAFSPANDVVTPAQMDRTVPVPSDITLPTISDVSLPTLSDVTLTNPCSDALTPTCSTVLSTPMPDDLDKYQIKYKLGEGTFGMVFRATDSSSGKDVAIKQVIDPFTTDLNAQGTYREVFLLRAIRKHPNIVTMHNIIYRQDKDLYIVQELMDTDLLTLMDSGRLLADQHRYIIYQLLCAVMYLHSGNIVHRDIKPDNILLDRKTCRVKLCDLGYARTLTGPAVVGESLQHRRNKMSLYFGSRFYRAPEVLMNAESYTTAVDVWSVGCILGEMLIGRILIKGKNDHDQVEKVIGMVTPPSKEEIAMVSSRATRVMLRTALAIRSTLRNLGPSVLDTLVASGAPDDGIELCMNLLKFNPDQRTTAKQALEHRYVALCRDPHLEIGLDKGVVPPLSDEVLFNVHNYKAQIQELVTEIQKDKTAIY